MKNGSLFDVGANDFGCWRNCARRSSQYPASAQRVRNRSWRFRQQRDRASSVSDDILESRDGRNFPKVWLFLLWYFPNHTNRQTCDHLSAVDHTDRQARLAPPPKTQQGGLGSRMCAGAGCFPLFFWILTKWNRTVRSETPKITDISGTFCAQTQRKHSFPSRKFLCLRIQPSASVISVNLACKVATELLKSAIIREIEHLWRN
ncbi:MAG: hypothetical protein U5N27_21345 [Rhizobium sp.]|nr:hypothetical protein [Rhizobium sp.]